MVAPEYKNLLKQVPGKRNTESGMITPRRILFPLEDTKRIGTSIMIALLFLPKACLVHSITPVDFSL
jgi:hypothetical protein